MSYASNVHRCESDDLFKMNSSSSFLIIFLRLGFLGVGLGISFGDE